MRRIEDERVRGLVHQYGYEAFAIMFALLLGSVFVRVFLLDQDIADWFDQLLLILVGSCYFTVRAIRAGILFAPRTAKHRATPKNGAIFTGLIATVIWGVLMGWRTMPVWRDGNLDLRNLAKLGLSAAVFFLVWLLTLAAMQYISQKRADREAGPED